MNPVDSLTTLPIEDFADRHLGPTESEVATMLAALGYDSLDALMNITIPEAIHLTEELGFEAVPTEEEALARLRQVAKRNQVVTTMIGAGYYGNYTPNVILRNIMENPAWYTAYTPYQPEISQGRLEALLNFQTVVTDLTGMDIANASMLDEATAAAEAMMLARRQSKVVGDTFFVDADCHPQIIEVVRTRAEPLNIKVAVGDPFADSESHEYFGILLSYPGSSGAIHSYESLAAAATGRGALVCVATDLLALTMLTPPGEWGADVAIGSAQRFGVAFGFGGPHAGFMAVRTEARRSLPGRLVGLSKDTKGRPALRLALQTREQHIRREKATSNICTAQVLLAVIAASYASYHGPSGLLRIAQRTHLLTCATAEALEDAGFTLESQNFFDTVTLRTPGAANKHLADALKAGLNLRAHSLDAIGFSCDETTTAATVVELLSAFGVTRSIEQVEAAAAAATETWSHLPQELLRSSDYLTHPNFNSYHSETEMLRYLRRLADKDLALDRTMIPLGSCTMKLNATAEMIPVTWPEFSQIHPFAPADQTEGYLQLIRELEDSLARITGYDAVSLQPNAGSQGEFAGLLAIRGYHRSRNNPERDLCLIPASAHGTNAASAVMAGMRVVVVATDENGNVNLDDLRSKAEEHSAQLAAIMVTYPSTHGVFEESIGELCKIIHDHGGQVYVDGANLNALVGVAKPGEFGADVSHLNLHKTFCIPHGGGGPGVGPVAVGAHLAPFLPNHQQRSDAGPGTGPGAVSAAPFGSASILPISWMYITMMGDRLRKASEIAILSANYIAERLSEHYPILYTGRGGLVAHECIIDLRPLEKAVGITNEDVAKRLMDYGFHAPTMSFPVPGTLMVEPTESEGLAELDRFCDAMISIRSEIERVASGEWTLEDNPLVHAPHTAQEVGGDLWEHAYPRSLAGWPSKHQTESKYWPPVSRIDGGFGDRNLVCSCPPVEAFAE
ncbi:MAG: aminomethyl-transferring glycine dehydrogenase [Actinobacteria bacterium]|uniref:glycine dehydrogenase (aminomethyl-transferring) n=1 Tax=freshwater metagenome TaxID=449393 RepID=A0A6J6T7A8_9ZZZZ|nr:aminomethyl-transferring glycine dehydrogenase [Actinomycetota bacterium]